MKKDDINAMFANVADAAEASTGADSRQPRQAKQPEVEEVRPMQAKPAPVTPVEIPVVKEVVETQPTPVVSAPVSTPVFDEQPVFTQAAPQEATGEVPRKFIEKVLMLNDKYLKVDKELQPVLQKYFIRGKEEKSLSLLIRNAIYTDENKITGLSLISKSYHLSDGAQRAFFLMGVSEVELGYIIAELSTFVNMSEIKGKSKIEVCQILESTISNITSESMKQIECVGDFLTFAK